MCRLSSTFLNTWNMFIIAVLMSCLLVLECHFGVCLCWLIFFPLWIIFSCMPGNFLLDGKHCEFYVVGFWFWCSFKYFWALLWTHLSSENSFDSLSLAFKPCWGKSSRTTFSVELIWLLSEGASFWMLCLMLHVLGCLSTLASRNTNHS